MAIRDKSYYLSLVTSQHQGAMNFMAFLGSVLDITIAASDCVSSLEDGFDIDTAVGDQLDIIGQLVGLSRILPFDPPTGLTPQMEDPDYRTALKLQIVMNHWTGQVEDWVDKVSVILPLASITVTDNHNMTIAVTITGTIPATIKAFFDADYFTPRPQGVLSTNTLSTDAIFGYDLNTSQIKGYDEGHWT